MTCEGELELTTSQLPYLGEGRRGEGRRGEGRGGEGRRGEGRGGEGRRGEGRRGESKERGGEGKRRELKDGKEKRCDTPLSLVSHVLHWSTVVTAVTMNAVRSYLNDSVIGPCGKPFVAWVHCNAPHPPKMAADNLRGTYRCDLANNKTSGFITIKLPSSSQISHDYSKSHDQHVSHACHMTTSPSSVSMEDATLAWERTLPALLAPVVVTE